MGSDKGYYFGVVRVFWKKYFVVGYVLEAPQNKSQKLFWGVTLVILPRVARIVYIYKYIDIYTHTYNLNSIIPMILPYPLSRCQGRLCSEADRRHCGGCWGNMGIGQVTYEFTIWLREWTSISQLFRVPFGCQGYQILGQPWWNTEWYINLLLSVVKQTCNM